MVKLPRFVSSMILLIMAGADLAHSEKVVPDLFPLAVGNSWTLALHAGGTREYVIASVKKDSLIFIQKDTSNGIYIVKGGQGLTVTPFIMSRN
jgi:hypothetical protein